MQLNIETVTLSVADAARIRDLTSKQEGLQKAIALMVETGERRAAQLQMEGRTLWTDLAKTYNLDLEHVAYAPSPDGTTLTPIQVKVNG